MLSRAARTPQRAGGRDAEVWPAGARRIQESGPFEPGQAAQDEERSGAQAELPYPVGLSAHPRRRRRRRRDCGPLGFGNERSVTATRGPGTSGGNAGSALSALGTANKP